MGFPILIRRRLYIDSGPWSSSHTKHRRKKWFYRGVNPNRWGEKQEPVAKSMDVHTFLIDSVILHDWVLLRLQLVFISFDTIKIIWSVSIYWISITVEVRCKDKTFWFDWGLGWGYKIKFLSSVSFSPLSKHWLPIEYCIHSTGLTVSRDVSI